VEGDRVIVRHVYTERRVTPLNLFLRDAEPGAAREAVIEYGNAIKDLAAADIFTGDMLLKNFGVTRHGRVLSYDYDELCPLADLDFREMPSPRDDLDEMSAEPWFSVGEDDIFPAELRTFLGLQGQVREAFLRGHSDLFEVDFWRGLQERHRQGEVISFFPYSPERRLRPEAAWTSVPS
jgi:isocitrate dehydrogenase kinase/phosphatase